jgi:hypothetical protein
MQCIKGVHGTLRGARHIAGRRFRLFCFRYFL